MDAFLFLVGFPSECVVVGNSFISEIFDSKFSDFLSFFKFDLDFPLVFGTRVFFVPFFADNFRDKKYPLAEA